MLLTRRRLLVDGLRVTAFVPGISWLGRRTSFEGGRALVVVQLTGGNDGLNTVVPFTQDAYYRLRPTLAQKRSSLHSLDGDHGLHPSMRELAPFHDEGRLTIVHGVGYPHPDRSHFRSLEIWHSGDPQGPACGVGWLGRMADQIVSATPGAMPALHVGEGNLPLALMGEQACATTLDDERSLCLADLPGLESERINLLGGSGEAPGELAFLRAAARNAYEISLRMERALERRGTATYPDLDLARKLRLIARLLTGGFDTRIFMVELGGFDTHARQAALHAARLEELARSLGAFERDLRASGVGERVLTLVFSEFGRRAEENASRGTDHGSAAPVLVLGGPGRGGLKGSAPDLERLDEGDVGFTTDFRALYTAIESGWMGLEPTSPVPAFEFG